MNLPSDIRIEPVTFRLPANGEVDPHFGMTRTFWATAIRGARPAVASFTIAQPNAKRGIRAIKFDSAKAYVLSFAKAA